MENESAPFRTVREARQWLERNGYRGRHGGGYEKPVGGCATMIPTENLQTVIRFHDKEPQVSGRWQ